MSREVFIPRQFRAVSLAEIERANAIISEYTSKGYRLTLRQLFYQHVARDLLPNNMKEYQKLSRTMVYARDAGISDWNAIEDRTRSVSNFPSWDTPAAFLASEVDYYAEDLWAGQQFRPELWIEKDALIGVVAPVCEALRVPYFSTRGNVSQPLAYQAGKRFEQQVGLGLVPVVLHLADHDPSGVEMTSDLQYRLNLYSRGELEVRRIALTMAQVRRHRPPPNFAKETDANLGKYVRQFRTNQCWELDALSPEVIDALIRADIEPMIDAKKWAAAERREKRHRKELHRLIKAS